MDGQRFDRWAKALATGTDRRKVLRGLAAGAAGLAGVAAGRKTAEAAPGVCQQRCGKNAFTSGPEHAACLQACRACERQGTPDNLCFTNRGLVCCPADLECGFNCQTGQPACCELSTEPGCEFACAGTCPGEFCSPPE
jgi:hypothetical protein